MNKQYLESALYYAEHYEWKLFPAYWKEKNHIGYVKWGTESSNDPEIIRTWAQTWPDCYFCVALRQSGYTVLDVDNKLDKNGTQTLKALEFFNAKLPLTPQIETPSGGYHIYFKGDAPTTVEKLGKGLDTPAMVPIPESTILNKGSYSSHMMDPDDIPKIAPLPEWISKLLGEATTERVKDNQTPAIELDLEDNVKVARAFLYSAEVSIEGEGGNDTAYNIACRVRDFGLSIGMCLDLLLTYWNHNCEPPWSPEELNVIIEHAYSYAKTQAGSTTPQADFKDDLIEPSEKVIENIDKPRLITEFSGIAPPRKWIIEDWLPESEVSSLIGDGGLGKSLVSIQLAAAIASKGSFMNLPIIKQMPTLVVACEDDYPELHRRIEAIRTAEFDFMNQNIPLYLWARVGKNNIIANQEGSLMKIGPFYKELTEALKNMGDGSKFLVLDTLSDIFAGNENDRSIVNFFVKVVLSSIAKKYNTTILFLAHPSKSSAKSNEASGSTAWNAVVRNRLHLTRHDNENLADIRVIRRMKSNYSFAGEQLVIQWNKGAFKAVENSGNIFDPIEEENLNLLLDTITLYADKKQPIGRHHNSEIWLNIIELKDCNNKNMSVDTKKRLLTILITRNLVVERKGEKHGNGLWPVVGTAEETIKNPF